MTRMLPFLHSLRGQLTFWNGLVLAIVLVAFTVAVYDQLASSLAQELDRSLADRALQVNNAIPPGPPQRSFPPPQGIVIPRPVTFASADTFVQVVTLDGDVVVASDSLGGVRLPATSDDLAAARGGLGRYALAEVQGERVRMFTAPLIIRGQPAGAIQVARSFDLVDHTLSQLRWLAGIGLLIALGLSSLVVRLATGVALKPIERVIETAGAIGASGDLARRVPPLSSSDEVGRLATTFNRMLDRLETSATALREAFAKVENSLEAQRRFVADASHELRTPLTTIRGNAGLLSQFSNVTPEDQAAAIQQISQEAERMSRLVQDLLTLARADGGQSLPHAPVMLAPLVRDIAAEARILSQKRHTISVDIRGEGEVDGNSDTLRQLLLLLFDNAVKYTPPGGQINVRLIDQGTITRLEVEDTGIGIAPEVQEHIFERFFRADLSRHSGGTGLGLAIAKWIVEQHGGTIEVESTLGHGSTFSVLLPVIRQAQAEAHR